MNAKQILDFSDKNVLATWLFGLCPLLASSTTLLSGLLMGGAALFVLLCGSVTLSLYRYFIPGPARLVFILLVNASWVIVLDLLLQAHLYELGLQVGIYIPLLAVNATVLLMQEQQALRQHWWTTAGKASAAGLLILLGLASLGGLREFLVSGGLFTDLYLLPANVYTGAMQGLYPAGNGALLFNKPAGAFICFGLLLAAVNYVRAIVAARVGRPTETGIQAS